MPSDRPTRSHGTFTPASTIGRVLTRGGHPPFLTRRDTAFGGHRSTWDRDMKVVVVRHRCGDDIPDDQQDTEQAEMLALYEQFLTGKGYRVERSATGWLLVHPKTTT